MGIRNGAQYLNRLKDHPREVWLAGEMVKDVTEHPVFKRPLAQMARLYDMQADPCFADTLTYPSPIDGKPVGTAFLVPKTQDDLFKRREAFRIWAESTFGLMGRSPDFLNTALMAFAEARDFFAKGGERFAENVVKYYEYVRENDLFLTHALITPQIDRSKTSAEQADEFLHMGVFKETEDGLIIRGARMLATLGPVADEMLIFNLPGLKPGDEKHAVVFAIPCDTPGLRMICRQPYDDGTREAFNHPLSSNFEEMDALVVFDDVFVPWDRVFLYNDVKLANDMYNGTNLRQHTAHQTAVRGWVKMQFAAGVAMKIAQSVKTDQFLHVQEMLGEIIDYGELVKSCIVRAEAEHETTEWGTVRCLFQPLQTVRGLLPKAYPRAVEIIQILGAGPLLMMPSAADILSPVSADIDRYYQGADGFAAIDRIKLYKLAWDLSGDGFGQRLLQYERYYAGDPVRVRAGTYFQFDKTACMGLVDRALDLAGRPGKQSSFEFESSFATNGLGKSLF